MIVTPGATSISVQIQIVDDTGLPVTGLVAATFPTTYYSRSGETLPSSITLSDLPAQNSAYSSGGVKELTGGYYRLDVPDAAFATASRVRLIGEASGKRLIYPPITVVHVSANVAQLLGTAWLTPGTAGTPDVNVKLISGDSIAADNLEAAADGTGYNLGGGSVVAASVTGAVGSVTGNVGGNVTGSVGSITGVTFPSNFGALGINASGHVSRVTLCDTVTTLTGYVAPLDAAGVRTAVGLGAANLDTQLNAIYTVAGQVEADTQDIQTQIGSAGAGLTAIASAANLATVAGYLDTEIAAILEDTGTTIPAQIAALNNLSAAQVNAEVVDALNVDTYAEPGQGAPPATASIAAKVGYLYKAWRNRKTQTETQWSLYADDATTVDQKAASSDDGTVTALGEVTSGP